VTLARCSGDPACPVRFRFGPPRPCVDHAGEDYRLVTRAADLGVTMSAVPAGRSDGTSADDGSNGKQKVNRHGIAVR
jgi:hypothetical protein